MRRSMIVALLAALTVLAAPTALAKPPAGPVRGITAVTPSTTFTTATDDCGTYRLYDAYVTLSWSGSTRLRVYLLMPDGTRNAPGEVWLNGTGTATVTVPDVLVPEGTSGVFEAFTFQLRRKTWEVQYHLVGTQVVSFPAA